MGEELWSLQKDARADSTWRSKRGEAQFQNYDTLIQDLAEITELLTAEAAGISLEREVLDHTITPRGDAVLEFANPSMEWKPVLRFRVSSHMLAETSPIFARHVLPPQRGAR